MKRLAVILCTIVLALGAAHAAQPPGTLSNPQQEARARALQKELRCVVCQGESLDESNAPLAADLRHLIRVRIAAGDTDEDVKRFLIARYGDFILMKPPLQPNTYLLWFGPAVILLFGAGFAGAAVVRARRRAARD